jgi:hypothetical protein
MIGNGAVSLKGRVVAKGVLVQIRPDADSWDWHGTLFMTAGSLVDGESLRTDQSYRLDVEDGSSGDFMVTRPERVDAGTFVQVQGSGAFRYASVRG